MVKEFENVTTGVISLINEWQPVLEQLPEEIICNRKNHQNRSIKQILGHMIDSASNNTHRIVHFHYQDNPVVFPDYANLGNNDRWINIQNYQDEDRNVIIQLWKYSNIHLMHVIGNVDSDKLDNEWINAIGLKVSLREMIVDYLRHFKLHISEINELINSR